MRISQFNLIIRRDKYKTILQYYGLIPLNGKQLCSQEVISYEALYWAINIGMCVEVIFTSAWAYLGVRICRRKQIAKILSRSFEIGLRKTRISKCWLAILTHE